MKYLEVKIKEAILCSYILKSSEELRYSQKRPAVIVCPGGSYIYTSDREGEPVAVRFLSEGMNAFVLHYSVSPARFPIALTELAASVAYIREHAEEWNIDPEQIFICGLSAGGHLCGCLGTMWNQTFLRDLLKKEYGEDANVWKPSGMILAYPMITTGEFTNQGAKETLLGADAAQEMVEKASLENQVDCDTVPAFFWQTQGDTEVPVENALLFATALRRAGIPFELHIYETGAHGTSLCNKVTALEEKDIEKDNEGWIQLAVNWIDRKC